MSATDILNLDKKIVELIAYCDICILSGKLDANEAADFKSVKEELEGIRITLNDPDPIVDTNDSVQEELNINEAKNIIKDTDDEL